MTEVGGVYPKVDMTGGSSSFPDMEREVGAYWDEDGTFQASLSNREGCEEYVFLSLIHISEPTRPY